MSNDEAEVGSQTLNQRRWVPRIAGPYANSASDLGYRGRSERVREVEEGRKERGKGQNVIFYKKKSSMNIFLL